MAIYGLTAQFKKTALLTVVMMITGDVFACPATMHHCNCNVSTSACPSGQGYLCADAGTECRWACNNEAISCTPTVTPTKNN